VSTEGERNRRTPAVQPKGHSAMLPSGLLAARIWVWLMLQIKKEAAHACSIALSLLLLCHLSSAADVFVREGDAIVLDGIEYRLSGIDAPELDQICLNQNAAAWLCGIEARDRLRARIGNRAVHCEDKGPDRIYQRRRAAVCWIEGETQSLNQWLVLEGWALNVQRYPKGGFHLEQADARKAGRGLWKGCFAAPRALRRWRKHRATLLGSSCGDINIARTRLFSNQPLMPPGCSIKARIFVLAKITGHRGIYSMEGCSDYARTNPNRWFCSEEDARAQAFRKSSGC
jgi:endonuclease YncB( thermonuclease family)